MITSLSRSLAAYFVPAAVDAVAGERMRHARALAQARAAAAPYPRIRIDRDGPRAYWVTCADLDDDPQAGNNFHCDGADVLAAVEAYVELLRGGK